jgi:hypothetical protein
MHRVTFTTCAVIAKPLGCFDDWRWMMGWIRHHGIVVTGSADTEHSRHYTYNIQRAHEKATELGLLVSEVIEGATNGYASIFIAPDGSKEGWDTSEEFSRRREKFKEWISGKGFDWFEYADDVDNGDLSITASSSPQKGADHE